MSEISLYSGLYEAIRRWADLIDDLLIELKAGTDITEHHPYNELKKLISGLASGDIEAVDFSDQRVATIVQSKLGNKLIWQELLHNLSNQRQAPLAIPSLEAIAHCLAAKHADTVAKMRGGIM